MYETEMPCYVYVVPVVAVNVSPSGMIWERNIGESATHVA
jgi:hypothetical protein